MTEQEKYKIAKGEYDGPYSARYHDQILYKGELLATVGDGVSNKAVAIYMNMAHQAGYYSGYDDGLADERQRNPD